MQARPAIMWIGVTTTCSMSHMWVPMSWGHVRPRHACGSGTISGWPDRTVTGCVETQLLSLGCCWLGRPNWCSTSWCHLVFAADEIHATPFAWEV
jgi:hypothetical protein